MDNPKLNKAVKILIIPEFALAILAIYALVFWLFPFLLTTAISMSGF